MANVTTSPLPTPLSPASPRGASRLGLTLAALLIAPALAPQAARANTPDGEEPPAGAAPTRAKVLVLPFQAVFRSVDQKKLNRATEYLFKELGQKNDVEIVRGAAGGAAEGAGPSLAGAEQAVAAAEAHEKERRYDQAIAEWQKAVAAFEANAPAITTPAPYYEAQLRLARAYFTVAKDKESDATLEVVMRMAPGHELARTTYSRLFRKNAKRHADKVLAEKPGKLLVKSALPGANVTLDGRPMQVAPVLLDRVVPGKHLVVATVPGVPPFGAFVVVESGKQAEVRSSFAGTVGGSSVGKVADALSENTLAKDTVEAAAAAGKEAGAAFVTFGAMAAEDDGFRVHTFVVDVGTKKVHAIEKQKFDLELLTAESEVLRIVNAMRATYGAFPASAVAQVGTVDGSIKTASVVTTVDASPSVTTAATAAKGPAKADGPRRVIKTAKDNGVKIKDE
jgi:tetratricopeptide (TPR) repeat protein